MLVNVTYSILCLCSLLQLSSCVASARQAICSNIQNITVNIVLNGLIHQKKVSKDRCKLISSIDTVIDQSSIRYNKIRDLPNHWSIYLNGEVVPSEGCVGNNAEQLKISNGDYIYVFLNEKGLTDPHYIGEYMKFVSKEFSEVLNLNRNKPSHGRKRSGKGKMSEDTSNILKLLLNQDYINRVIKEVSSGNGKDVLLGLIAKFIGASAQAKPTKGEPDKHEPENNKQDPLMGLLTLFTQPLLEGFMGASKKNTEL
ncbi:signal peptide containing protein [Theileria equi strain WA]|uniref:Signal peptide containing protein n=1 Tax=Theileria equi strain WA TaxID=1537102 RepID=L1LED8_THEEQ|nr:signal peptide containing protein [Theileria equi strain WA]EKX73711.1 signal peptide containing protein [Theileria equi strain WA]|eukprot:XP_004833163.1 signal peptide containing protein [Theileria equi strain WA]